MVLRAHFVAAGNLKPRPRNGRVFRVKVEEALVFGHRLVVVALLKQVVGKTKQRLSRVVREMGMEKPLMFHGGLKRQSPLRQAVGKCFDGISIRQHRLCSRFCRESGRQQSAWYCGKCG